MISAPSAACYAGCGWWRALMAAAQREFPDTPAEDILDCGAAPGFAMAALRAGQRQLVLDPTCPAFAAVAAAAARLDAVVLGTRPPALDLAEPGAARRLVDWVRGDMARTLR
ncbi:MAG TPA: hypothetical protein VGH36_04260 [Acetobacteraceae bacterium]